MSKSDDGGGLWRVFAKLTHRRDQIISQVRKEYFRLDPKAKQAFRAWLEKLALAGKDPVYETGLNMSLLVHLEVEGLQETEQVTVSPQTLLKALTAWDSGEEYIPGPLDF